MEALNEGHQSTKPGKGETEVYCGKVSRLREVE